MNDVYVAILAGGSGTRLWPRSRRDHPKQLQNLVGKRSMLQQTVDRVLPLVPSERVLVLTGPDHAKAIRDQLPQVPPQNVLVEPYPRGTGPSLGLAAQRLRQSNPGHSVMISLHADHVVLQEHNFRKSLITAAAAARRGFLVTVGIVPNRPETGYGYIERGSLLVEEEGMEVYRVARFVEKPPPAVAREFVASGRYYWNAGYFAWTLDNILEEFQRLLPETSARLDALVGAVGQGGVERIWAQVDPITIDVGIMEHARKVAVIPCEMGWSDVGSWAALHDILEKDAQGNVFVGQGQHVGLDTAGTLVYGGGRLVATLGIEDLIIVETGDALLVLPKDRAQDVSRLVRELRDRGFGRYL